jgi:mycothiol synthase
MDPAKYTIRPHAERDYDAVARINAVLEPRIPQSADELRHWDSVLAQAPDRFNSKLVVEESGSGEVVAWGTVGHTLFNYHPDKYWVQVAVLPSHQGQGVGREVYRLLEHEALDRHAAGFLSSVREGNLPGTRFAERRGFVAQRKVWMSRLDLTQLDLSHFPDRSKTLSDQGIRFSTLAEEGAQRPELLRSLYEVGRTTGEDVPRVGEYSPYTFDEFVSIDATGPKAIPEAFFLALQGAECVAWSTLEREIGSSDTIGIGYTGTLRRFRGRGIASELKRRAVTYAKSHGYRSIITHNDSTNEPIWAINRKLGFRPEITWVQLEKRLHSTSD